jgi:acyl-CoA synthetase (AMP-forming)/AMP-acid ligase II
MTFGRETPLDEAFAQLDDFVEAGGAQLFRDGWMRTGDLAARDDRGWCSIVRRLKDAVMKGGHTIYLNEVEDACPTFPVSRRRRPSAPTSPPATRTSPCSHARVPARPSFRRKSSTGSAASSARSAHRGVSSSSTNRCPHRSGEA